MGRIKGHWLSYHVTRASIYPKRVVRGAGVSGPEYVVCGGDGAAKYAISRAIHIVNGCGGAGADGAVLVLRGVGFGNRYFQTGAGNIYGHAASGVAIKV